MRIKPCPKCGRMPKITEGVSFKDKTRRRFIGCPNYCSAIKTDKPWKDSWIFYAGNEDDNTIYRIWNERIIK